MRRLVAIYVGALVAAGCQEVLGVGTERLPPPDVEVVDEGEFSGADPCGMLVASPAVRLSGTAGNSTRPAIAVLDADGPEPRLLVAWLERDEPDDERVHARMILPDGSFVGPLARVHAEDPTSVAIGAVDDLGSFALAIADGGRLDLIPLIGESLYMPYDDEPPQPVDVDPEPATQRRWTIEDAGAPSIAVLQDRVLVAGLGTGGMIRIFDVAIDANLPAPCDRPSAVAAEAVDIVAEGDAARLAWIHDGGLYAARLSSGGCACSADAQCDAPSWEVPEGDPAPTGEGIVGRRLRSVLVRGTFWTAVPRSVEGGDVVGEIWGWTGDAWSLSRAGGRDLQEPGTFDVQVWEEPSFAIGVQPGGRSLVLARPTAPAEGTPAEIVLERGRFDAFAACEDPLACLTLTADLRDSHEPEMIPLADGFGVVWSDDEPTAAGTQRDIYYAKVTCAGRPPS